MVLSLKQSQAAWGHPDFNGAFKAEVEQLPHDALPLQQGLALSSYVSHEPFKVMVISSSEDDRHIHVKAGVFYSGIIAGCSCADDPTPTDVQAEYCDLQFDIDKQGGETHITLLSD
jgi:hypothetical protein